MGKNLLTTVCECGHSFNSKDVRPPLTAPESHKFYGGNVKYFCTSECPVCGKEYVLYLKPEKNTYTVIDMEEGESKKPKQRKPKDEE
jgi:hypothetical protein